MQHARKFILFLLTVVLFITQSQAADWKNFIVKQVVSRYQLLEQYNRQNDRRGHAHLNQYVIELDENWIEERPQLRLLKDNYPALSEKLRQFNGNRADSLRFYVVVVNNYEIVLRETLDEQKLPAKITDLGDLVTPIRNPAYQQYRQEITSIPAQIDQALQEKKVKDRVIYFYGRLKLYKLGGQPHYYKHDNLSLLGGKFKEADQAIRAQVRNSVTGEDPSRIQIEKVIDNVINAIQTVVDKGYQAPRIECGDSYEQMLSKTAPLRTPERIKADAKAAATLLEGNYQGHMLRDPRMAANRFLALDSADAWLEDVFLSRVLPEKLTLLADPASNSPYQLFVVFKEVPYLLSALEADDFARAVAREAKAIDASRSIVVTLPYLKGHCANYDRPGLFGMPFSRGAALIQPGVACPDAALQGQLQAALRGLGNWEQRFRQAYGYIPKKHVTFQYAIDYQLSVVEGKTTVEDRVSGYEDIYELQIGVDNRFREFIRLEKELARLQMSKEAPGWDQYYDAVRALPKKKAEWVRLRHGLRESVLRELTENGSSRIGRSFVLWFVEEQGKVTLWQWMTRNEHFSPQNSYFVAGYNPEVLSKYYQALDNAGLVLGPFNLDWLTDGAGYLLASHYQDGDNQVLYATTLLVPLASTAAARAIQAFKEGKLALRKGTEGTLELVEAAGGVKQAAAALADPLGEYAGIAQKLDATQKQQFLEDFATASQEVLQKLNANEGALVDSWKKIKDFGADEALRRNPDALAYLANGRSDKILLDVEELLGGHSKARHGSHISMSEMEQRVLGTHPSMPQSRSALKFVSDEIHEDAVNKAFVYHKSTIESHFGSSSDYLELDFDYGSKIGEGFTNTGTRRSPTSSQVSSNVVRVAFKAAPNSPGGYILDSAYPLFE